MELFGYELRPHPSSFPIPAFFVPRRDRKGQVAVWSRRLDMRAWPRRRLALNHHPLQFNFSPALKQLIPTQMTTTRSSRC
jgi:hypothetical protein